MAFPFGSPTLGAYIAWARSEGCECKTGYGGIHGSVFWVLTAKSGKHVTIVGLQQDERLTSSYINNLDRRLGLTSPFPRISLDS